MNLTDQLQGLNCLLKARLQYRYGIISLTIVPTIYNYKVINGVHCHLAADTAVNALETYLFQADLRLEFTNSVQKNEAGVIEKINKCTQHVVNFVRTKSAVSDAARDISTVKPVELQDW